MGHNLNAQTEAIRVASWTFEVQRRADANARSEISRAKKKDPPVTIDFDESYNKHYIKLTQKQNPKEWFSTSWLTFLLIGFPAGDDGRTVVGAGNFLLLITIQKFNCIN